MEKCITSDSWSSGFVSAGSSAGGISPFSRSPIVAVQRERECLLPLGHIYVEASEDAEAAENYKLELARIINEGGYSPDQIFKADETALHWKKLPSKTFISKNQRRSQGFKPSKERITLHAGSNLSGSLMMKPMTINRSATPHVMKNINKTQLPVFWRSNKKAWMTQDLFKDWFYNCFIPAVETYTMEKKLVFQSFIGS
ncbi:tigger transposable element-derived protein 1 [Trichonephila clavipes]|nr:tigger transposable element-derived protein 1 [Trichonephila clavipes]